MDEAASNVYDMEEASSATESLDEETRSTLVAFPIIKVFITRKGIAYNCMQQMVLLE